jgi:hypothetical protein
MSKTPNEGHVVRYGQEVLPLIPLGECPPCRIPPAPREWCYGPHSPPRSIDR